MPIVPINKTAPPEVYNRPEIVARVRVRRPIVASSSTETDTVPSVAGAAGAAPNRSGTPNVSNATSYKVGYGRPPKNTQFPKGRSGNPKGRPKGAKGFNTIVRETLTAKIKIRTADGRKNTTSVQALMMQTLESALKGSQRDRHELLRYYREAVPNEPETVRTDAAVSQSESEDIDAHDRAILERLRNKIIDEFGRRE